MSLLDGQVAVITAAAGTGIGFAAAKLFQENGAKVLLSDRHPRRTQEAAEKLGVPWAICDVTDQAQVDGLFAAAIEAYGHVDILVNNAGLGGTSTVMDMQDEAWNRVMDVTLTGTMRCTRAALQHMVPRGSGVIVNNASVLGWRAQKGQAHYAAAKAGVMALTRCSAVEVAEQGVRINAVAPSLAMHAFLHKVTTPELLAELQDREAMKRAATPEEIAKVMLFLASDLSSYMTGEIVSVSNQRA
jgi:3-oxoacyl-[acyl-carrier protein] reductase